MAKRKLAAHESAGNSSAGEMHYPNNRVVEAMIDFQVQLPPGMSHEPLLRLFEPEMERYARRGISYRVMSSARFGSEMGASASQIPIGYAYQSKDGGYILEVRVDGFTFHKLRPYETWEPFRNEAKRLWDIYYKGSHPVSINKASVRYINQFDFKAPVKLERYFRTYPEISPDLPQTLSNFFIHLEIPQGDGVMLLLNQGSMPSPDPNTAIFLLDIELVKLYDTSVRNEEIWNLLDSLRPLRNKIFQACITKKILEEIS